MSTEVSARLDPEIFRLPVERIREGYYSDAYFVYTKQLLEDEGRRPSVTMQVFQKQESLLGGIDEAIAVLKLCSGRYEDGGWVPGWESLSVHALHEGDRIAPHETVLFEMRIPIPAGARLGNNSLTWELAPKTYEAPFAPAAVWVVR